MSQAHAPLHDRPAAETDGPLAQSVGIALVVLRIATIVLALVWAGSNVREIGPGNQAVVERMGRIVRAVPSGLVVAWPAPIERLVVLPGPARQMQLRIVQPAVAPPPPVDPENGVYQAMAPVGTPDATTLLTADGEIVRLDTTLTWRITDPAAYVVAADHVPAALRRLFLGTAVEIAASHPLDDFLSVRPERAADPLAQAARVRLRQLFVDGINARLASLAAAGAALGVAVTRADITPLLPEEAKLSFDAVLDAAQQADQGLAVARTDATQRRQLADRTRDRILTDAHAAAAERIDAARAATATIAAYETQADTVGRPALLAEIYRTRIAAILRAAGKLDTVPAGDTRVILPSPRP
jgi:regulator of protease activity HflC (stomatin/prohibitin superfamily)